MNDLMGVVDAATGAEGGLAVVLVAVLAYLKAGMAAGYAADDVALKHLERNADRNLDELSKIQDRYLDVLERAAMLQGQLAALEQEHDELEREHAALRQQLDTDEIGTPRVGG